ncbi:PSD1 and planctomycete cytochrome C domain-containing protein [Planctomyces sp. SH-PL14]|uniref:PSD1 and planctomycete cytochrome C domain-containing protein n=1 Tax=Planctomyces sp. SH-PL14 TaxID=1632864 RepID=UPI00078D3A55|nr:PSD1 and planctomycete cytochrome C domain-containing protein [Planctomyces sp. SH-PL14]AMV16790.1 Planctomycete cytochrome C [Planctomyces sp. SH-PL14]
MPASHVFLTVTPARALLWRLVALFVFLAPLPSRVAAENPSSPMGQATNDERQGHEYFERNVRPLLSQHCFSCHAKGQAKGGLSLADRKGLLAGGEGGAVVSLEKPNDSPLIAAVEGRDGLQMPPNSNLSDAEVAVLKRWIELGAPWPEAVEGTAPTAGTVTAEAREFWAFQSVKPVAPPTVQDFAWVRQPLDRFVLAALEAQGLRPVEEADRRTFIRRATFDLTGLPPSPQEVAAFLADDAPDADSRLVDRLLASPQYGERWGRTWLDVARYGEDQAHTFQARTYPNGYRYRDWVVAAFNADLPYDQFVVEQIAGDLLPASDRADEERKARSAALGYFALGPVYYKDAGCAGKAESDELDDRIDTLCRGFLGLTVSCARCHDHKFDPISTKDYYALAGVFASTEYREVPLVADDVVRRYDEAATAIKDREKAVNEAKAEATREAGERFAPETAKYIVAAWRRRLPGSDASAKADAAAKDQGLKPFLVDRWVEFLKSDIVGKRPYLAGLQQALGAEDPAAMEKAAVLVQDELVAALQTRDQAKTAEAGGSENSSSRPATASAALAQPEILKDLLTDRNAPFAIPKDRAEKLFSDSAKARLTALQKDVEQAKQNLGPKYPFAHSLADAAPKNLQVHLRGNHKDLGDEVPRRFLTILTADAAEPFHEGSGRLELARAIASPANPLTARVMVNRIWLNHFGRGLVGTPSNFGLLGERPTHPELLDYLADRFVSSGWSIKELHREILLSATYRLSSDSRGEGAATALNRDPDNRLLWRQNRRRLEIEAWRDAMLLVGDRLDDQLGGPAVRLDDAGNRRRTLYAAISRHDLNGTLRMFDFPDPNLTSERRVSTTVPMQQLFVLNSEFLAQQARALSQRIAREASADDTVRIAALYSLLFQRDPTEAETQVGLAYLQSPLPETVAPDVVKLSPWERYAQVLLGTNEFLFLD